jgi:hypothetical protein
MKNKDYYLTVFLGIVLIGVFNPVMAGSTSIVTYGDNEEEIDVNWGIQHSDDEGSVLAILTDPDSPLSTRKTCVERLEDIGTSYSLSTIEAIAQDTSEDPAIQKAASLVLWKIRYRDDIDHGGTGEDLLLSIIDLYKIINIDKTVDFETGPVPFTPRDDGGNWCVDAGSYGQLVVDWNNHLSFLNDPMAEDGVIDVRVNFNGDYNTLLLCFGLDNAGNNGYALMAYCYYGGYPSIGICYLSLYKLKNGDVDWGNLLGSVNINNVDVYGWHNMHIELAGDSITANMDGTLLPASDASPRGVKIALGTYGIYNDLTRFDDVRIQYSKVEKDFSDITKTPEVITWAMGALGDMGSQNAAPYLNKFMTDAEYVPYMAYFKQIAQESLDKISFINSFPVGTEIMTIIQQGLTHPELCVRLWALNELVKQNPPDLIQQLQTLLDNAQNNGDYEFAYAIEPILEEEIAKSNCVALDIVSPQDGVTVESPYIEIMYYNNGEPCHETRDLVPGPNTLTITVQDINGCPVSQSITVNCSYCSVPPVLSPIGDKQAYVGQPISFTITATDPDPGIANLLYDIEELPDEMNFDYTTHTFSWTPTGLDIGDHVVKFKVDDGYGLTDEEDVTITVTNPNEIFNLVGSFTGKGVWLRNDNGTWANIHGLNPRSMTRGDLNGDGKDEIIIDFGTPHGIWVRYGDGTWSNIHGLSPKSMVTGDMNGDNKEELVIDFGAPYGIWVYDNGSWSNLHGMSCESMVTGDLNGDGKDEIIINFGIPHGIWVRYGDGTWSNIHGLSPKSMVTGDMNGDNKEELVIDFGTPYGIWVYDNGSWSNLHGMSCVSMVTGDLNGDGKDEIIIDFGAPHGVWVRYGDGTWSNINGLSPKSMVTGDINGNNKEEVVFDFDAKGIWVRHDDGTLENIFGLSPELII